MARTNKTFTALVAVIAFTLAGNPTEACGQRTMDRQYFVSADAVSSCQELTDYGVSLSFGQYGLTWYWRTWLNACPYVTRLETGHKMTYGQANAGADFMYRLASDRSRVINLYAGGGAFLGIESYNMWRRIPSYLEVNYPKARFLYGISASLELEAFISRSVAMVLSGNLPVAISSLVGPFNVQLRLGVRVTL